MGQCQGMYQTPVGPGGIPLVTSFAVEKQSPWALPCYGKKKYIVRDNYDNSVKNLEPLLDEIDDILSVNLEYDFDNVKPPLLAEEQHNLSILKAQMRLLEQQALQQISTSFSRD